MKIDEDIVVFEDGYSYFWPIENKGAYSAYDLRLIADELDRMNEEWEKVGRRLTKEECPGCGQPLETCLCDTF